MNIGGFLPFSLTDFPGRVAAVIFVQGCNFCCPYCHNRQLIPRHSHHNNFLHESNILARLETRVGRLGGVTVSGGEPTLQEDLPRFLHLIRALGFDIKLDTNGSRPELLKQLLSQGLLSYIAMDIKAPLDKYDLVAGVKGMEVPIRESISLIAQSGIEHEFRVTWDRSLLSSQDIGEIRTLVPAESFLEIHNAVTPPHPWCAQSSTLASHTEGDFIPC